MLKKLFTSCVIVLSTLSMLLTVPAPSMAAHQVWQGSPLLQEYQEQLEQATLYMKKGKYDLAIPIILSVLESANDIPKCIAIADFTEPIATPMMEVRRQCMQKALSLCQNRQDYILVCLKSRQWEFFEITRQAINSLIDNAKTVSELYDLARKAQEVALNDVAHMAMERAYTGIHDVPAAIKFARECKAMGIDDLVRQTMRDLIDDENNAHQLCMLLTQLEPFGMLDLNRYLLKKALDKATTPSEYMDIYEAARRQHEQDIYKVADYRAKKLKLIQQIQHDHEEYAKQLQNWKENNSQGEQQ